MGKVDASGKFLSHGRIRKLHEREWARNSVRAREASADAHHAA